jgi:hypothetical protein
MRWQHRQMYQDLLRGAYDAPSVDSGGQIAGMGSGEFAAQDATVIAPAASPEATTFIETAPFRFGARLTTQRSLTEVVVAFLQSWRNNQTTGAR